MRFLTLSAALLLLGFVYAGEPSLECAMYAEACETLCVLSTGGERAVPQCAAEASACLCDDVDMSDYVNENAVSYINNLNENDLVQFVDSSYKRYAQMAMEASGISPEEEILRVEKPQFNLVLDGIEDAEDDSDEAEELQDQNDVEQENEEEEQGENAAKADAEEGMNPEAEVEAEAELAVEDEVAGEDMNMAEDEDEEDEEDEEDSENANETSQVKEKSTRKSLSRAQDPFCQTFISRCKDDCPAAESEVTCAIEDTDSGYMLACACNGVDISASVYAQVKAESKAVVA